LASSGLFALDRLLGGGYPERSAILIEGPPGNEREALIYKFLQTGLVHGLFCIYVTRLPPSEVVHDAKAFNVDLTTTSPFWISPEGGNKGYNPTDLAEISFGVKEVLGEHQNTSLRIAFDCTSQLLMLHPVDSVYRFLSQLLSEVKKHDAVALATVQEGMHQPQVLSSMELLFDGVVAVRRTEEGELEVHVKKMRGVDLPTQSITLSVSPETTPPLARATRRRVAVLPFVNMSPDPNDEFFADGLTEELIGKLSQVGGLEVIARTSVMNYKKKEKNVSQIGRELNVGTIMEGSVRKAGNRIRVTTQLINAGTEGHLWSSNYDRNLEDVFSIQSEIAEKVAGELKIRLVESDKRTLEKKPTENTEAYNYYLRGKQLLREESEAPVRQAIGLLERAIELDPSFARAYVALAECYQILKGGGYEPRDVSLAKVKASLERALVLDPDLPEAHASRSELLENEDDLVGAEAEARKAVELNPSLPDGYYYLYQFAGTNGELDEMVRFAEAAYRLDPVRPLFVGELGWAYFCAGREQDVLEHWSRTEQLAPAATYSIMTQYFLSKGDHQRAKELLAKYEKIRPNTLTLRFLVGAVAAREGDREKALESIRNLEDSGGPIGLNFIAFVYHALGDLDSYFEYVNRALEAGTLFYSDVRNSPLLARARADPRYQELMEKVRKKTGLVK
jgi:adenylate cyclase